MAGMSNWISFSVEGYVTHIDYTMTPLLNHNDPSLGVMGIL
jgi:hypothetical protein